MLPETELALLPERMSIAPPVAIDDPPALNTTEPPIPASADLTDKIMSPLDPIESPVTARKSPELVLDEPVDKVIPPDIALDFPLFT